MVFLLLNLAVIPDSVAKKIDFSKFGWSVKFKNEMDNFKLNFEGDC